jgi:methyltransferase-like protein/2-polyprenyl-3-methyl-5-hydroxy-6-metoxy-1,4-benzoquinol methylase
VTDTAASYDQVPYTSLAFPQTHPDHLAGVARIFSLSPPDVAACRVLELGCASGGNLMPMAFNLPGSDFVGIDVSQQHVDVAQESIRALQVRNLRIERASILDVDRSWGTFDYILCHGVFSWVEPEVQDAILRIAGEQLSPQGVAYVSYNTYPGWHVRQMVRDMMKYHAEQFADAQEQIAQARALLTFLASASQSTGVYGQLLAAEAERANRADDSYVFHEHLERTNLPLYFHQFIDRAAHAGLQYLAESIVAEMLTTQLPAPVAGTLERISPDLLHLEQYLDFVRNRQFRQTLLCRAAARPRRNLTPDVLVGLRVSSAASADPAGIDFDDSVPVVFTNGKQRAEVRKPATKAALAALAEAWPCAIDVEALCATALERAAPYRPHASEDEARAAMLEDLFGAVMHGLVNVHTLPPPCVNRPSNTPRAHPVAAFQAQSGPLVVNAHHQMLELDSLAHAVITLADGRRTRAQMLDALRRQATADRLGLADVDQALATLARHAVLVA